MDLSIKSFEIFGFSDLQSPGYSRLIDDNKGLRINESISFSCSLEENQSVTASNSLDFICNRLSSQLIKPIPNVDRDIPSIMSLNSFLMKNETKFIGVLKQTNNSEEFNQIVSTADPHMTLVLTWSATVNDNNSAQRVTFGQHFVQLRHLYETISCPAITATAGLQPFNEHEQKISIYNIEPNLPTSNLTTMDEIDQWCPNDV